MLHVPVGVLGLPVVHRWVEEERYRLRNLEIEYCTGCHENILSCLDTSVAREMQEGEEQTGRT